MGKIVTVMNMKGGVGKTTVCMHIGGILGRNGLVASERRRLKVLLIDYDPQFNMSQAMLRSKQYYTLENENKTCLSILQDNEDNLNPFEIQTPETTTPPNVENICHTLISNKMGHLDIIVSTLNLMFVALGTSTGDIDILETRFKIFIDDCRKKYDLVMIDCHPAGSILTRTSLKNSDHVLIPVAPQAYALRGIALMMKFIKSNSINHGSPNPHILFNLGPKGAGVIKNKPLRPLFSTPAPFLKKADALPYPRH